MPIPPSAPTARWPARRCSRTSRRATSRSARPTTGARCAGAVGALHRRLPLHRRGPRRVDDRPRLGRPGADLRERRPARRGRALRDDEQLLLADIDLDRLPPTARHDQLRRLDPRPPRACSRASAAIGVRARAPAEAETPLRRTIERFPYVPADPPTRDERCYEVYNIQVHGLETRLRGDRHREGRDRRLRRPRLDARADRRRPRDGPARPAAREHPRLHDARLRHDRAHQGQRLEADAGARRDRARDRHPPVGRADAPRPRPPVRERREASTTSPSRTSRPASAPATCSGSPTTTAGS